MRSVKRGVVKHRRRDREMNGKMRVMSRWGNAPAVECLDWDWLCLRLSIAFQVFVVSPLAKCACVGCMYSLSFNSKLAKILVEY